MVVYFQLNVKKGQFEVTDVGCELERWMKIRDVVDKINNTTNHYRQIGGVAMGSRMGPNYACLFVGYIEERIRSTYTGFVPQLHKRYIDDVVGAAQCSRLELENFINHNL